MTLQKCGALPINSTVFICTATKSLGDKRVKLNFSQRQRHLEMLFGHCFKIQGHFWDPEEVGFNMTNT
jgi:hypothetical protein